ncbi:hypothetical protein V2J09_004032 [Rumex salicifolius]
MRQMKTPQRDLPLGLNTTSPYDDGSRWCVVYKQNGRLLNQIALLNSCIWKTTMRYLQRRDDVIVNQLFIGN